MTTRQIEANRTCVCGQCGHTFNSVRYNAEYCSAKCRKRRQRELERIDRDLGTVINALEMLQSHRRHVGEEKARLAVMKIAKRTSSMLDYWD